MPEKYFVVMHTIKAITVAYTGSRTQQDGKRSVIAAGSTNK